MRLSTEFLQLPLLFDPQRLQADVDALPALAWRPHPQGFAGNSAASLVARHGDALDDSTSGPFAATCWLEQATYLREVLSRFGAVLGRCRLMRLDGQAEAQAHADLDYYWQSRLRIHVAVRSRPAVRFYCGDATVHMAEGEVWVFDTTRRHRVLNPEATQRIHLVLDCAPSATLQDLMQRARRPTDAAFRGLEPARPALGPAAALQFERRPQAPVMPPQEQRLVAEDILALLGVGPEADALRVHARQLLAPILADWQDRWLQSGASHPAHYEPLQQRLHAVAAQLRYRGPAAGAGLGEWIEHWLARPALSRDAPPFDASRSPARDADPTSADRYASRHTASFPALLEALDGSLLVTTYAANRIAVVRAHGEELNTHFRRFDSPMGAACSDDERLAIGTAQSIWEFRRQPGLSANAPGELRGTTWVPARQHCTGDVRIHELAWGEEGLWFVNTRHSCLARLDGLHNFVPCWRPRFVSRLGQEDACHLNGLAMRAGRPQTVTALGTSGLAGGWRGRRLDGGVAIDVPSGELVAQGLCMPHSPRWHQDALWLLDSGRGALCRIDVASGERLVVATVPGFARGLALVGPYAFVGMSRVRERDWFGGLPITEGATARECGVHVIDLSRGTVAAWLTFDDDVHEIFDLQWLPGLRWPDLREPDDPQAQHTYLVPDATLSWF